MHCGTTGDMRMPRPLTGTTATCALWPFASTATRAWSTEKRLHGFDLPPDVQGVERDNEGVPTGRLFLDANWRAQSRFIAAFSTDTVRKAERRAVGVALSRGIVHLHAQLLGRDRDGYREDLAALRALPGKIHPKICEPDATLARDFGLRFIGGDVFLDGSIGSCTAALSMPYEGSPNAGDLRFSDEQVHEYFSTAEALGIAAGVHAIGDAAIDQCLRTWQRVLHGRPSTRGTRHFIEHFEMANDEHIAACAAMGIHLSMQPQFDAAWGATGGMYDERLGARRSVQMNALRTIDRSGAMLCGGSDAPVCALDARMGIAAALSHHRENERLDVHSAVAMYTINAAHLAYAEHDTGNCEPGLAADLVVLDRDPFNDATSCDASSCASNLSGARVLQTWIDGSIVYDATNGSEN